MANSFLLISTCSTFRVGETRLSAILRSLLDPNGSHGQGGKFLDAFLHQWELPSTLKPEMFIAAKVENEFRISNNQRIDRVIWAGRKAIALENKPWAADFEDQVKGYLTDLERRFADGCCLLYLSGSGEKHSKGSIPEE